MINSLLVGLPLCTISIHAPLAGSDLGHKLRLICSSQFQSTLPLRGATLHPPTLKNFSTVFQSTLPSRGATDADTVCRRPCHISIHAPLAGSDPEPTFLPREEGDQFQSTLPSRGATTYLTCNPGGRSHISIHAPLAGSDGVVGESVAMRQNISIHAPLAGSDKYTLHL